MPWPEPGLRNHLRLLPPPMMDNDETVTAQARRLGLSVARVSQLRKAGRLGPGDNWNPPRKRSPGDPVKAQSGAAKRAAKKARELAELTAQHRAVEQRIGLLGGLPPTSAELGADTAWIEDFQPFVAELRNGGRADADCRQRIDSILTAQQLATPNPTAHQERFWRRVEGIIRRGRDVDGRAEEAKLVRQLVEEFQRQAEQPSSVQMVPGSMVKRPTIVRGPKVVQ